MYNGIRGGPGGGGGILISHHLACSKQTLEEISTMLHRVTLYLYLNQMQIMSTALLLMAPGTRLRYFKLVKLLNN